MYIIRARVLARVCPYVHASSCVRAPSEVWVRVWWLCVQWACSCMGAGTVNVCRAQVLHPCGTCGREGRVCKRGVCVRARAPRACARMCFRVQRCLCARVRACAFTRVCTNTCIYTYTFTYVFLYMCVCVSVCILRREVVFENVQCVCVCVFVCGLPRVVVCISFSQHTVWCAS